MFKLVINIHYLTVSFFETGAMATPTKSQNPTIMGLGVLASTQLSHPSRSILNL